MHLKSIAAAGLLIAALAAGGCGSGGSGGPPSRSTVTSSLTGAGWQVKSVNGMPKTVTGKPQLFYLQTTAPDGAQIDMQFFADHDQASEERVAAQKQIKGFRATAVGPAIVFSRGTGRKAVPNQDLTAAQKLLDKG